MVGFDKSLFEHQSVVVTGGSRGIGAAAARAFAEHGATVFIVARTEESLAKQAKDLCDRGLDVHAIACDINDYAAVERMFSKVAEISGKIDIVFANAGVLLQKETILESDPEIWQETVLTNLVGSYNTARAAINYMTRAGGGKLLFTGSGRGRKASSGLADYSCSKAGQWMLVRCLAAELAQYNIAVNEIVPGPVATNMDTEQDSNADIVTETGGEILKKPEDVVELILFVASQSNTSGPSGQTFALNRREI